MIASTETIISGIYTAAEGEPIVRPFMETCIPAGFPSPADDCYESMDIGAYIVRQPDATYFMRVTGESMKGVGITPGDIIVVDRSLIPEHGNIVVAVVNGEMTVKRLYSKDGVIELRPENPKYRRITFSEGSELEIWGVVRNVVKTFV